MSIKQPIGLVISLSAALVLDACSSGGGDGNSGGASTASGTGNTTSTTSAASATTTDATVVSAGSAPAPASGSGATSGSAATTPGDTGTVPDVSWAQSVMAQQLNDESSEPMPLERIAASASEVSEEPRPLN